jgi:hypothetical protein
MTVLFIAVLLGIPGQRTRALGAELVAPAAVLGAVLNMFDRRATASRGARPISRVLADYSLRTITTSLLALAGALLLAGVGDGIYVLVPCALAATAGGVANA